MVQATTTNTQTLSHVLQARPHDVHYDPLYTVASKRDQMKAVSKANTVDVTIAPNFPSMFSTLRHFPASQIRFRSHVFQTNPVSSKLAAMQQPQQAALANYLAAPTRVIGSDRHKFFRRPIVPYVPSLGGSIVYAKKQSSGEAAPIRAPSPPFKTIGVQTLYRESEAQTDPYSPEYTLPPGAPPPELLALSTLTYGAGLPAGLAEVEMIERARAKRAWEADLPTRTDGDGYEKRMKLMEDMELREWEEREQEIQRLQDARLDILKKVIKKREEEIEELSSERLSRMWQKKLQEKEALSEKIQKKKIKALRKLMDKRNNVEPKFERRNIIADYTNFASEVYAPKARNGAFKDTAAATVQLKVENVDNFYGLENLEKAIGGRVYNPNLAPPSANKIKSPSDRKELHMQHQLAIMDQKLKERKLKQQDEEKPLRFAVRIEKPPQRPITPVVDSTPIEIEECDIAAVKLQRLIRGRLVQNIMYEGKERRARLIQELRDRKIIEKTAESEAKALGADVEKLKATKPLVPVVNVKVSQVGDEDDEENLISPAHMEPEEQIVARDDEAQLGEFYDMAVESEFVGETLDFMTKELVRLREERRIAAMVKLADRTRRMREAEESGRRQAELKRREREDEVFRQVMQVQQESIDSYLENIIVDSIDQASSDIARDQVREYATRLNAIVDEFELKEQHGEDPSQAIVADLVASFLIPEVERATVRGMVKQQQSSRLLHAAHSAVNQTLPGVEQEVWESEQNAKKNTSV